MGRRNKGRKHTQEFRANKRLECLGRHHNEETKCRLRKYAAKRFLQLNIGTSTDKGAHEYFDKLNSQGHSIETDKYFPDIGYFADGYDKEKHIWYEYDTIYHNKRRQQEKHAIRQNRIVKYFNRIGNPLCQFIRIKA